MVRVAVEKSRWWWRREQVSEGQAWIQPVGKFWGDGAGGGGKKWTLSQDS